MSPADPSHLQDLERYYDGVPRISCRAEVFGPLTLFVRNGPGHPFYARPTLGSREPLTERHIEAVRARQVELGLPQAFEWVGEITPELWGLAGEAGLAMAECPLMVLTAEATAVPGVEARMLASDSPELPSAIAVQHLAFAEAGTARGSAGPQDLAPGIAKALSDGSVSRTQSRLRDQLTSFAAVIAGGVAVSAGQHNPLGDVTEIVGVGTLPSERRRGLGLAVAAALVADARSRGIRTVFLSAADEDVARIYGRLGFRRVGTAMIVG